MEKLNIAVVAGGDSTESIISVKGGRYVISQLNKVLYDSTLVYISKARWYAEPFEGKLYDIDKNDFSYINDKGEKIKFDFAVIVIHGTPGENGILQSYLELVGVPYSSSGVLSNAITFDKTTTKAVVEKYGVRVAKEIVVCKGYDVDIDKIVDTLGLPLFIKPSGAGSSFGVSKVKAKDQLLNAINEAYREDCRVVIEEFIEGREVSCGMFKALDKEYILPVTEIISENDFFDFQAKYEGKSNEVTPADFPKEIIDKLAEECRKIYKACVCSGLVRIDFIIRGDEPYMIEVNSVPGMSAQSIVPQQLAAMGMSTSEMYDLIIQDKLDK